MNPVNCFYVNKNKTTTNFTVDSLLEPDYTAKIHRKTDAEKNTSRAIRDLKIGHHHHHKPLFRFFDVVIIVPGAIFPCLTVAIWHLRRVSRNLELVPSDIKFPKTSVIGMLAAWTDQSVDLAKSHELGHSSTLCLCITFPWFGTASRLSNQPINTKAVWRGESSCKELAGIVWTWFENGIFECRLALVGGRGSFAFCMEVNCVFAMALNNCPYFLDVWWVIICQNCSDIIHEAHAERYVWGYASGINWALSYGCSKFS